MHTISYNSDGNVCYIGKKYDVVYDIVCDVVYKMARTPHKTYDIVHFIRCRIRYRMYGKRYRFLVYDIVFLTYAVVYDIVYDVVYKNGKKP